MDDSYLNGIRANNHRIISRVISRIENNREFSADFYSGLYDRSKQALRIGLTGPPGVGKSTLTDQLIRYFIQQGMSVGVVAVDPTSPFSGGSLLGDRIRMNRYVWDDSVFIRSMSSGGDLGGLTHKAQEVGDVMAASGKDVIIYETVGVGQAEHDVAKAVDVTILILVPESGDEIQLMKAGLIEIADIFVINKSDREGAGRLAQILKNILHTARHSDNSEPLVFNTVGNTGEGVEDFIQGIFKFIDDQKASKRFNHKRLTHHRDRVLSIIQDRLIHKFWTSKRLEKLALATKNLDTIETSPQQLAQEFIGTGNEKKRKRP